MYSGQYENLIRKYAHRFLQERMKEINVTRADAPYLYRMLKQKTIKMNELINHFSFHKSHATRAISKLVEDNLITKEVDPEDKRGYILTLTEKGEEVGGKVAKIFTDWEEMVNNVLTDEESKILENISKKIFKMLKEYFKEDNTDGENI